MSKNVKLVKSFFPRGTKKVLMYAHLEFFGELEVRNWRLCMSSSGQHYTGYPNAPLGKDGKRYRQVIPRTEELQDEILELLIRTHDAMIKTKTSYIDQKHKISDINHGINEKLQDVKETVTY